ncbi:MAG: hypothetical protein ACRDY7_02540 [Acidimicrobiia bacterium]
MITTAVVVVELSVSRFRRVVVELGFLALDLDLDPAGSALSSEAPGEGGWVVGGGGCVVGVGATVVVVVVGGAVVEVVVVGGRVVDVVVVGGAVVEVVVLGGAVVVVVAGASRTTILPIIPSAAWYLQ